MRVVMFYHSLVSDWNHGNAHFLRGVVAELMGRGHRVTVYEPEDGWSLRNLLAEHGQAAIERFRRAYPQLESHSYMLDTLDLDRALDGADLVLVHEWNAPELVQRIGAHRARARSYRLLFHDTHHRAFSDRHAMARYDLSQYDGVLAFGKVLRDIYLERGWAARAWVWHEAADTRVFQPADNPQREGDLVWIGNWADGERDAELREFVIEPARALRLRARAYGVRYPSEGLQALASARMDYGGWLPNHEAPAVFARFKVTVHVPRRPYAQKLRGIPTIRVFEALACGIPLVCAPWEDSEHLFEPGKDYVVARDGDEMKRCLRALIWDRAFAEQVASSGLAAIRRRHTCGHRVTELLQIHRELETPV